jgi:hypothetical protein
VPHDVTIWFALDGNSIYLGTADVNRQWVRNVQKTPKVSLLIGGERFEGKARFLGDRLEHKQAQARIRRKYWMYWPVFLVVKVLVALGFVKDKTGSFEVTLTE